MLAAQIAVSAVLAACPSNVANDLRPQPAGRQLITVQAATARTTHASLRTWRRAGACWRPVAGPFPARVGYNGLSANRREGDGTTPLGTFGIARTMYGNAPNPGVRFRYRRVVCGDWWDEDPASPTYNTFQHVPCGRRPPFRVKSLGMWQQPRAYPYLAVVEFNMRPVVPGRGSGIFLHAQTGGPTQGCISVGRAPLLRVLRWLAPEADPHISIRAG
jgi:L,D-peptidoglycan transpeptidase YkuD (ErfK/YbiS/YcfS/YnhG family)